MINDIAREVEKLSEELGVDRKRSIGEAAKELKVEPHVIRFWEENFEQIKPEIGAGKRRYYYNKQLKILKKIKKFLYEDGYTVAGLQKLLTQRKQDAHKEEDLDVIIKSVEKKEVRKIEIDDFLDSEMRIKTGEEVMGQAIDPQAKIKNFAGLKIPSINPKTRQEILELIQNTKENLKKLKAL
jgi:DNA-binding transcriptional MerR regulator